MAFVLPNQGVGRELNKKSKFGEMIMKKWGWVLLACTFVAGCGGGGEFVYLTNQQNQQVKCGPFSSDRPIARYLEERFGEDGAADATGDSSDMKMQDCIRGYQRQGYQLATATAPTYQPPQQQMQAAPPPAAPAAPQQQTSALPPPSTSPPEFASLIQQVRSLNISGGQMNTASALGDAATAAQAGNYAAAVALLRPLADAGNSQAQLLLGKAYESGLSVPQDYVSSHKWYNLAAAHSATSADERQLREFAVRSRDTISRMMSQDQIAEAQRMAREWVPAN